MNPFIQIPMKSNKEIDVGQKSVPSEKELDKEISGADKYLTQTDKLELQLAFEKSRSSKFEIDAISQRIAALRVLIQNYELRLPQLKTELESLANELEEKKIGLTETGTNFANTRTRLSKKYELVGKWDFDQDTGKIKC